MLIKPVGYALSSFGVSPFYHPRQVAELKKKLGITLDSTKGLLSRSQFGAAFRFSKKQGSYRVLIYRKKGMIKPVGYALSPAGIGPYYHPHQVAELKKKLGITLDSTKGLLTEKQFGYAFGSQRVGMYRIKGLIKPVGYAMHQSGVGPYYHPHQVAELKKKLGITLDSIKGLLTEKQCINNYKLWRLRSYRKKELIKPFGFALSKTKVSRYYHPRQIKELKAKLKKMSVKKSR